MIRAIYILVLLGGASASAEPMPPIAINPGDAGQQITGELQNCFHGNVVDEETVLRKCKDLIISPRDIIGDTYRASPGRLLSIPSVDPAMCNVLPC